MGVNTLEVIEAASTKWNFQKYRPGLVGGHCIPVDPYYLVYKAEELGYSPQVILAGRNINNSMPKHVAELTLKSLNTAGKVMRNSRVLLMGLTFKENVRDCRTSPAKGIISSLREFDVEVVGFDPMLETKTIEKEFGIKAVAELKPNQFDAAILAVGHEAFRKINLKKLKECMKRNPILIDARGFYDQEQAKKEGFIYQQL